MSASDAIDADLYALPDDATVNQAIADYARIVREAYGKRVKGVYLFGSRARGGHTQESDADIAVVLSDGNWEYWAEKMRLTDLSYDILIASGADIQCWPVRASEWKHPQRHRNPALVRAMRADGRPLDPLVE